MGTQQILMIILSVIVVGTAIAVGIQMFDTYYDNARRQQGAVELQRLGAMIEAWYRTPVAMGGGGNGKNPDGTARIPTIQEIARYLNRSATQGSTPQWTTSQGTIDIYAWDFIETNGALASTARIRMRLYYDNYGSGPLTTRMYYFNGNTGTTDHSY